MKNSFRFSFKNCKFCIVNLLLYFPKCFCYLQVELELWNNAFKDHIDNFRLLIKEKKNTSERSEIQTKLMMFLDASIGFYFQLLQEFCDKYDLDLPYHGKPRQLGILSKTKKVDTVIVLLVSFKIYVRWMRPTMIGCTRSLPS